MYGGDLHTHNQCGPKCVNQFADPTFAHLSLSLSLSLSLFCSVLKPHSDIHPMERITIFFGVAMSCC